MSNVTKLIPLEELEDKEEEELEEDEYDDDDGDEPPPPLPQLDYWLEITIGMGMILLSAALYLGLVEVADSLRNHIGVRISNCTIQSTDKTPLVSFGPSGQLQMGEDGR